MVVVETLQVVNLRSISKTLVVCESNIMYNSHTLNPTGKYFILDNLLETQKSFPVAKRTFPMGQDFGFFKKK